MSSADVRWFRSKIDWWMWLILVALPVVELGGLVAALRSGDGEAITSMAVAFGMVAAIYGLLVIPVRYGVSTDRLVMRFGVVRRYIDLAAIREVYPTHNPLSSPALSLDRLAIRTGPATAPAAPPAGPGADALLDLGGSDAASRAGRHDRPAEKDASQTRESRPTRLRVA